MDRSLISAYNAYLEEIKRQLVDLGERHYSSQQYQKITNYIYRLGFSSTLFRLNRNNIFQTIIKHSEFIHPQDAGFGAWFQRLIYEAHGGGNNLKQIMFLGGFHNLLMGYIDNLIDETPEYIEVFKEVFPPSVLFEMIEGNMQIADKILCEINDTPPESLIKGILLYLKQSFQFSKDNIFSLELWREFVTHYGLLYRSEFNSAKLLFKLTEASDEAFQTCIVKTADVIIPHAYLLMMDGVLEIKDKEIIRTAFQYLGKAMVIAEDLCDIIEDTEEEKWNYVTLTFAKNEGFSGNDLLNMPLSELICSIYASNSFSSIISEMVECFNKAFDELTEIGDYNKTFEKLRYILWYPIVNSKNKQNRRRPVYGKQV